MRLWRNGKQTRDSSTGESEYEEAERKFARWLTKKAQPSRPKNGLGHPAERLITETLNNYLEERAPQTAAPVRISYAIDAIVTWWGDKPCSFITEETCAAYVKSRIDAGRAVGTVRRELTTLRAALNWAVKKGRMVNPPFVWMPPAPRGRDRWLTVNEAARLLNAARAEPQSRLYLPLAILVALYTSARVGAILGLKWPRVDLVNGVIDLRLSNGEETNKRRARVPIPQPLLWFLKSAQRRATSEYVIHRNGQKIDKIRGAFNSAVRRADLEDVTFHTLRHTSATWMAQGGVDLRQIAGYLGHSQSRTTELYAHHSPEFLGDAKRALENRNNSTTGPVM